MTSLLQSDLKDDKNIQLGQASMNPPDFCLKWGDFNIEGSHAWKAKVLPTWNFEVWRDITSSTSLVGSRWPDPAVLR